MALINFRATRPFGCQLETNYEDPTINESSGTDWSATASHAGVAIQPCDICHGQVVVGGVLVRHKESARVDRWTGPGEVQLTLRPA
ncbi:MAG TPA: hypothetical protein DIU18_05615 [Gemmatimonadetes bacterium]|nr:hypothetical protein [Gemmatimonadota bacterium]